MTAAPVALRDAEGTVVVEEVVVVEGVVGVLPVGPTLDVGAGGDVVGVELPPGDDPAAVEVVGVAARGAGSDGAIAIEIGADFVWKLSTATRPATVATATIGARLIDNRPQPGANPVD